MDHGIAAHSDGPGRRNHYDLLHAMFSGSLADVARALDVHLIEKLFALGITRDDACEVVDLVNTSCGAADVVR